MQGDLRGADKERQLLPFSTNYQTQVQCTAGPAGKHAQYPVEIDLPPNLVYPILAYLINVIKRRHNPETQPCYPLVKANAIFLSRPPRTLKPFISFKRSLPQWVILDIILAILHVNDG